jgi:hypothetical protein
MAVARPALCNFYEILTPPIGTSKAEFASGDAAFALLSKRSSKVTRDCRQTLVHIALSGSGTINSNLEDQYAMLRHCWFVNAALSRPL